MKTLLLLLTILLTMVLPSSLFALTETTTNSNQCSSAYPIATLNGANANISSTTNYYQNHWSTNKNIYLKFTPLKSGEVTISEGEHPWGNSGEVKFYIGSTCGGEDIVKSNSNSKNHGPFTFNVNAGATYYVSLQKDKRDYLRYSLSFSFTLLATNQVDLKLSDKTSPSPDPVDISENVTFKVRSNNLGPDTAKKNIVLKVKYNQDITVTSTSYDSGGDFSCDKSSGTLVAGDFITCTKNSDWSSTTDNKDFTFIVQSSTSGTLTQTATISSASSDPDTSNNTLSTNVTVNEIVYIENADDLCYEERETSGTMCMDMEVCSGGIGCKSTYPLKNIGADTISSVEAYYNESGMSGSFSSHCGVEPSGSCQSTGAIDFGPIGLFGKSTQFTLNNDIVSGDNSNKIWTEAFMSGSCFSQEKLYATYKKGNSYYRGKIKSCDDSTPPSEPEDETIPKTDPQPEAPTCGVFEDALQTHDDCASGSDILIKGSTIIYNNNGDTELSTCSVTDDTLTWGLSTNSCNTGECTASGTPSEKMNITYANAPQFDTLNATPTASTTDLTLPGTFNDYEINTLKAPDSGGDAGTINVTNSVKINTIDLAANNTLAFESPNAYNVEVGSLTSGHHLTLSNSTNAKNIKIKDLDAGSDHATIKLTASQTIKMNSFKFGNTSTVVLKAKYIQINDFDFRNASNTNLTIYADYLDIGNIRPNGNTATITIKPYTTGKRILARFNDFHTGAASEYIFSSGNYYINDTMYLHGSGTGAKLNLEDASTSVNFYLNKKPDAGNNFVINATGLNGGFDANKDATQFNLYVNGDFKTGTGGTTINATVYAENDISITSGAKIKGALSAGGEIKTNGANVEVTYDQSVANSGWAECGVTIGFDKEEYQTKEDYSLFDNFTSELNVTIELSSPVSSDTTVTYTTRDGTAKAGATKDYISKTGTATILAGETTTNIYIDIVHDVPIELDEYFYVDLSNINPSDGSITMGINPVKITILGQGADDLPLCYSDTFNGSLDDKWRTLKSRGGFSPKIVNGRLRLTDNTKKLATAVTKDYKFASKYNMIVSEFEQYSYGGCGNSHSGSGADGADGIVLVLYNSDVGASPVPGGSGGSIGYAQYSGNTPGFEGGWLGLGIDEYGNFANCNEERIGGLPGTSCDSGNGFNPQNHRNIASIRGDGSGMNGYEFLAASQELSPKVAHKNTSSPDYGHKYKMTTDARDPAHLYITLERDTGSGYVTIINKFDAKDPQYGQNSTPDFVRFAFTSGTGGGCNNHEIDNLSVRGYCQPYDPNPPATTQNKSDAVNGYVDDVTYNLGTKYIKTKVAGKVENITGVHLDDTSRAVPYSSRDNLTFKIIPYLSDSTCSTRTVLTDTSGNPAVINVTNGNTVSSIDVVMPKNASKDSRISLSALDFQQIYDNSNQQCIKNASTTGNLQGISQCANSGQQYLLAFGQDTYDRCYIANGKPCKPNNHGIGNAPYNNSYGCLMCTLDTSSTCSSDNFAIRPDGFSMTSSSNDFPDLLRASEDYTLTLKAFNFNNPQNVNDTTNGYSITNAQGVLTFNTTLKAPNGTIDNSLHGSTSWSTANIFDILNGISTNGTNNEVASLKFDNVGKVNIEVVDKTWAEVDLTDDSGVNDPSATRYNNCNADGAYICGDINTTFIPHHFTLTNSSITNSNNNPGSFTYLSTLTPGTPATYAMAARVTTTIEARNKDEGVTTNFKTASYENPMHVQLVVNDGDHGAGVPTEIGDGTAGGNTLLNFPDGTYTVPWNEANNTKMLRFNFTRTNNVPVNPFQVTPAEVKIVVNSIYTAAGTPASPVTITQDISGNGSIAGNITQNATFIYGRTNASRQRFVGTQGNAFIYYEAYCSGTDGNGVTCNKTFLPNSNASVSNDDPRWFINKKHTNATEGVSGNITQKNSAHVTEDTVPNGYPTTTAPLTYDTQRGYPYKATMENNASSWLIYNKYNAAATTNEFEVEFTDNNSSWAGQHETNTTTNRSASDTTNRRSMW